MNRNGIQIPSRSASNEIVSSTLFKVNRCYTKITNYSFMFSQPLESDLQHLDVNATQRN